MDSIELYIGGAYSLPVSIVGELVLGNRWRLSD